MRVNEFGEVVDVGDRVCPGSNGDICGAPL
jgi:hypothetical protein